ncbi:leucine--tRNA ligase [Candidatus Photodesmus anomalopis]|uniref:Leucine--tRNA ligase n=1 Tax=Candidatus Photodesmus katoptron Akat1 TaxID=1236703 RepID=S3EGU5_9GAMM|nr:leucine--tRNA ligase [Candidatus Photodesmus katoptron]EPE37383.1 leucyl-tRNA synthetase LeuRS [Candidatus Photodesmus katoptron Akat1]
MQEQYNPHHIEEKVQKHWENNKTFVAKEDLNKEKFYCLSMFPYPSGKLHMGHVRNYTIGDVISRFQRLQGKNVMQPIGWDAFGLPAENSAIKNNIAPSKWTYKNIQYMRKQLKRLGFSYDWNREFSTCTPEYYQWEQKFFVMLYKQNLVYKKTALVNWCPNDQTVLANEQAEQGLCWRCDTPIKQKKIPQWFIKISTYAEEILNSLEYLDGWPEMVRSMQRNWIGRSEGTELFFPIKNKKTILKIFTKRLDTIMGVTYIAISTEHPLAEKISKTDCNLSTFIKKLFNTSTLAEAKLAKMEKKGMFTNLKAIHPLNGREIPIYVTNFVFMNYGTGAIMAVPAHNQCDYEFAIKYGLAITPVIRPENGKKTYTRKRPYTKKGILFNSGEFNGLTSFEASNAILEKLKLEGKGKQTVYFRLRDWNVSRQRYWGAPIPMLTTEDGKIHSVSTEDLPVILPEEVIMKNINTSYNKDSNWAKTTLKGQSAIRETDTFDTFMESSWYYARHCSPKANDIIESDKANYWLPVDQYIGGIEHSCMHLLYARFFHKLLRDNGYVTSDEPFKRLLCQGMVLSDAFFYKNDKGNKEWVKPSELTIKRDNKGVIRQIIDKKGRKIEHSGMIKMSKSKKNGVDPKQMVDKYGADTVRLFIMFASPAEMTLEWRESGVEGANRFLNRMWKLVREHIKRGPIEIGKVAKLSSNQKKTRRAIHRTIIKVNDDIERRQTFNTAIAAIMKLANQLSRSPKDNMQDRIILDEGLKAIVLMLYPITPHISYELWNKLDNSDIDLAKWPKVDEKALIEDDTITIVAQVNGKLRANLIVSANSSKEQVEQLILNHKNIVKFINTKSINKLIYIPNKLINIVTD